MKKNYLVILMLVLCLICVGCGNKENTPSLEDDANIIESGEVVANTNSDSIEIIEEEEKIVVNMYGESTTEYILSGDLVVDKREIFHFDSEEKAKEFVDTLSRDRVVISGSDVILESLEEGVLNLTRKDLLKTYKNLKEEYEYEQ